MDKQKKIEILKSAGYTLSEIIKTLKMGTDVFTVPDAIEVLEQMGIHTSLDEIKAGKITDIDFIRYNENENYIIITVH